jgi:RNA polymerase sigma factor (sigma-70 family)
MATETPDSDLLQAFATRGDGDAFGQIVHRHAGLVYAAAVRQVGPALADDVTQAVFVILHRKAHQVNGATLAGWLVKAARLAGLAARRGEQRRKVREQRAAAMRHDADENRDSAGENPWEQIAPLLDGALARLGEKDRCAVTLHYLEGKTAAEVARAMGLTESAAARRATRAVQKLRRYFVRHGVGVTGQLLGDLLAAHGTVAAPAALVAKVTATTAAVGAGASAAATASTGSVAQTTMSMMAVAKAKAVAVAATVVVLAGASGTLVVHALTAPARPGAAAVAPVPAAGPRVIRATTQPQPWRKGPLPPDLAAALPAESFTRFKTPAGQAATFTGRVEGLKRSGGGPAEVGIVSMVGVQWTTNANYQWQRVGPDGTFSVTVDRRPEARRALAVRAKGQPTTFLRAEFEPDESARDVVVRMKSGRTVTLTARGLRGKPVGWFKAEIFNAYDVPDDRGRVLEMQRLDAPATSSGRLALDLPLEPVALLISGTGVAPYYHVLDARDADSFQFDLMAPCRITGTVTRSGGLEPVPNQRVLLVNDDAPLSATARKTNAAGAFDVPTGVPGTYEISVAGKRFTVTAAEAETLSVNLDLDTGEITAAVPAK